MRILASSIVRSALFVLACTSFAFLSTHQSIAQEDRQPNIIFVMADDLGYGDLGCYGQEVIETPNLDRMAREGMRFRQFYAGCTVCAPSRAVLMTGQHMGHTFVRGNAGGDLTIQTLRDEDLTVAELLKSAGYATALCGKWGLGDEVDGNTGLPNDQGFDYFYGYLNQVHAHNYYPEFLWRNHDRVPLRNVVVRNSNYGSFRGGYATERVDYSHDLIFAEALEFIDANQEKPFFLYLALTIPHANNEGTRGTGNGQEVPDYGPYADSDWSDPNKGQAAMITRMDRDMGVMIEKLQELGIAEETIVMFTSDNGPHDEGGHDTEMFQPSGPLRGTKRDLYEGGIRVPLIAWCPGTIPANTITNHVGYFGDLLATAAEAAGVDAPTETDSISFLPTLRGESEQEQHEYLYWEFYERGGKQAVRMGDWKAIRMPMFTGEVQLFDVSSDLGEANDVSDEHPELVQQAIEFMEAAHTPHPAWQPRGRTEQKQPEPGDGRARF